LTFRPDVIFSGLVGNAPDTLKRLVDLSACNAQADRFDQDRKVCPARSYGGVATRSRRGFLSPDYKEEQLRPAFPNGPGLSIRHSDFVVRTSPGPFFTALGWDMDDTLDTTRPSNWGSVPLSPFHGIACWLIGFIIDMEVSRRMFRSVCGKMREVAYATRQLLNVIRETGRL
jgi:hypothetical protein